MEGEREGENERKTGREREREGQRERKRERERIWLLNLFHSLAALQIIYLFFNGMTGALAPFSYLV